MTPIHGRRGAFVTAFQNILTSIVGAPTPYHAPQLSPNRPKNPACLLSNTPIAVDEYDVGTDDCICHHAPSKPSTRYRQSQRRLRFEQCDSTLPIASFATTATITDTEDDDISILTQSKHFDHHQCESRITLKIRKKRSQKMSIHQVIGRASLRSATAQYRLANTLPTKLSLQQSAVTDPNPIKTRHHQEKIVKRKVRSKNIQKPAIRPAIDRVALRSKTTHRSILLSMTSASAETVVADPDPSKIKRRKKDSTTACVEVTPAVARSLVPSSEFGRPKRERIPTDFFQPSLGKTTDRDAFRRFQCPASNSFPKNTFTVENEAKVRENTTKSSPCTNPLVLPEPSLTASRPSKPGLVATKRSRMPTNFYRPFVHTRTALQSFAAKTINKRDVTEKKKEECTDAHVLLSNTHQRRTRSQAAANMESNVNCTMSDEVCIQKDPLHFCRTYMMRSSTLPFREKKASSDQTRGNGTKVASSSKAHNGVTSLNIYKKAVQPDTTLEQKATVKTRDEMRYTIPVNSRGIPTRSLSSRLSMNEHNSSCLSPSIENSEENLCSHEPVSGDLLLSQYNELVTQGRCLRVHFGKSLSSAIAAVDRTLRNVAEHVTEDIVDLDILEDVRQYKRSLRFFSIYEDREKLALVHEAQEDLESWCRKEARRQKDQLSGKGQSETQLLCDRPVILRKSCFLSRTCTMKCQLGPSCHICGLVGQVETTEVNSTPKNTPIPLIEPFDIDMESDSEVAYVVSSKKRKRKNVQRNNISRATIEALTELKNSLEFVQQYNCQFSKIE